MDLVSAPRDNTAGGMVRRWQRAVCSVDGFTRYEPAEAVRFVLDAASKLGIEVAHRVRAVAPDMLGVPTLEVQREVMKELGWV